jgi:hypothetical protein
MAAFICRQLPDGSAFLVRNAVPAQFADKAHTAATQFPESAWQGIHSRTSTDVHRVVALVGPEHTAELVAQAESESISTDATAHAIGLKFQKYVAEITQMRGLPKWPPLVEVEFLRVQPDAKGQLEHMDTFYNAWGFVLCLADGDALTQLKNYTHYDYPANITRTPRNWASMPVTSWKWKRGDMLVFKSNRIHAGPPNPSETNRYVLFGSTAIRDAPSPQFSDSYTITEKYFFGVQTHLHTPTTTHTVTVTSTYTHHIHTHTHTHTRRPQPSTGPTHYWTKSGTTCLQYRCALHATLFLHTTFKHVVHSLHMLFHTLYILHSHSSVYA